MNDKRVVKTYVWHGDDCYFVSTIERDSSAAVCVPSPRFNETIVWEFDWDAIARNEEGRGCQVYYSGDNRGSLDEHFRIVLHLSRNGLPIPDKED